MRELILAFVRSNADSYPVTRPARVYSARRRGSDSASAAFVRIPEPLVSRTNTAGTSAWRTTREPGEVEAAAVWDASTAATAITGRSRTTAA